MRRDGGVGIGYAAMPALILSNVPRSEAASSVGVNSLMRSIGTSTAGAVMAMVLTSQTVSFSGQMEIPTHTAFKVCFVIGAGASLLSVLLTLMIPRTRRSAQGQEIAATEELVTADA